MTVTYEYCSIAFSRKGLSKAQSSSPSSSSWVSTMASSSASSTIAYYESWRKSRIVLNTIRVRLVACTLTPGIFQGPPSGQVLDFSATYTTLIVFWCLPCCQTYHLHTSKTNRGCQPTPSKPDSKSRNPYTMKRRHGCCVRLRLNSAQVKIASICRYVTSEWWNKLLIVGRQRWNACGGAPCSTAASSKPPWPQREYVLSKNALSVILTFRQACLAVFWSIDFQEFHTRCNGWPDFCIRSRSSRFWSIRIEEAM